MTVKRALATAILCISLPAFADQFKDVSDIVFSSGESIRFDANTPCSRSEVEAFLASLELPKNEDKGTCTDLKTLADHHGEYETFIRFDFNNDGQLDLIYSGQCTAEENETILWQSTKSGYKFIKHFEGELIRFIRTHPFEPYSFLLRTGLCCSGQIGDYTLYEPEVKNRKTTYRKTLELREYGWPSLVPATASGKDHFVVTANECELRIDLTIANEIDSVAIQNYMVPSLGNIMAKYAMGSIGIAFASQKDSTGNDWYYVVFNAENKMTYNDFYQDYPSMKCGWVEAKKIAILRTQ